MEYNVRVLFVLLCFLAFMIIQKGKLITKQFVVQYQCYTIYSV
jgi:hypothetical protein